MSIELCVLLEVMIQSYLALNKMDLRLAQEQMSEPFPAS